MKNICACDNGHYNVQQGMSWSQCKQQNEKCLQIKDLNAKWDIWETWIYKVRLYMKWTMTLENEWTISIMNNVFHDEVFTLFFCMETGNFLGNT